VVTLWYLLRCFLSTLEPLPFVDAFMRPERTGDTRPLWVRWLNLQSLDVFYRMAIILRDASLIAKKHEDQQRMDAWYQSYREHLQVLLDPDQVRQHTLRAARELRIESHFIASHVWDSLIGEHWKDQLFLSSAAATGDKKEPPAGSDDLPLFTIRGDPADEQDLLHALLALHYTPFVLYVVRQIQNLMWYLPASFVLLSFALTSYSLQSPQFIGRFLLLLFVVIGLVVWRCLSGMERDLILSRIAGTREGELNTAFYLKFLGYGALPALSLLASEFPSISNFLYSWVEPTVKAMQ
jgi:hypothetical protein